MLLLLYITKMNIEEGVRLLREKIGDKIYNPKDEVLRRVFLHFENRVVPSMTQGKAYLMDMNLC